MALRIFISVAALLSIGVAAASYRFLGLGLEASFPDMLVHIEGTKLAFMAHIIASPIALAIGAFQFIRRLRANHPTLHRWAGRTYALAILAGGLGALVMAPNANGGLITTLGFILLSVLWIGATAQAVRLAMARRLVLHREWMIRSFAMTFAAVILRLELFPLFAAGLEYSQAIQILAWLSWIPNLIIAEWWIRRKKVLSPGFAA